MCTAKYFSVDHKNYRFQISEITHFREKCLWPICCWVRTSLLFSENDAHHLQRGITW